MNSFLPFLSLSSIFTLFHPVKCPAGGESCFATGEMPFGR
jgi:hypothetical protein